MRPLGPGLTREAGLLLIGVMLAAAVLPAADYRVLSGPSAAEGWWSGSSLTAMHGAVVLSAEPVAAWPTDLLVRRTQRLADQLPGRLAILISDQSPWRAARLRAKLPHLPVVIPAMLDPAPESFVDLRRLAAPPLQSLAVSGERRPGGGTLTLTSRRNAPGRWRLAALAPAGLLRESLDIELPARGTTTVEIVAPGAGCAWLLAVGEAAAPWDWPVIVEPTDDGLRAEFVPGRRVTPTAASLTVALTAVGRPRSGQLRPGAGWPFQALAMADGLTSLVEVPVPPGPAGFVRREVTAELVDGLNRHALRAWARSLPMVVAERREVRLDQRLQEWRSAAWQAVEVAVQVVEGADHWTGPADAGLRWAIARDDQSLYLAAIVSDDAAAEGDALELRWDSALSAAGEPGTATRRLPIERVAATGEWSGGWWLERRFDFELLGIAGEPLIGWDVVLRDADPGEPGTVLVGSGERWSDADPARLGLLSLRPERAMLRWWVEEAACDGVAMGN